MHVCSLIPHLPEFLLVLGHNIFKPGTILKIAFIQVLYSGLISRGENFKVFMDFALSSKF